MGTRWQLSVLRGAAATQLEEAKRKAARHSSCSSSSLQSIQMGTTLVAPVALSCLLSFLPQTTQHVDVVISILEALTTCSFADLVRVRLPLDSLHE